MRVCEHGGLMLLLLIWNRLAPKKPQGNERKGCLPEQQIEQPIIYYISAPTIPKRVTNGSNSETKVI